ncbi:hypothetical protein ACHWQZ_G005038 [Mnemiopsis leidyi]
MWKGRRNKVGAKQAPKPQDLPRERQVTGESTAPTEEEKEEARLLATEETPEELQKFQTPLTEEQEAELMKSCILPPAPDLDRTIVPDSRRSSSPKQGRAAKEPVIRNNKMCSVPTSHKQFVPHTSGRARVAALLPKELAKSTMVLGKFNSADSIVLRVKLSKDITLLLASIYMDITSDIPSGLLTRLSTYAETERLPLIVGADTNAHHTAWGHLTCNSRGRELLQALNANNLVLCNTACPITYGTFRTTIPWWTAELTSTKQTTKALRRKANRTKNNTDWQLYREANRTYSKLLKKTKRKGWKDFCNKIGNTETLARVNKILNFGNNKMGSLNSLRSPTGELTNSPEDTIGVLADTLIPTDGTPVEQVPTEGGGDTSLILKLLSPTRVDKAAQQLAKNKAPGPDEIRNEMITKAWAWIKDPIRMIFHHSLKLGVTPTSWQYTTGCIIPKPNKPDYTNPRAFRSILITSNFQKLLERLILWYLELDLKLPDKLTKNQHGFRKGKSTDSAIHILTRRIEEAMASGHYSLGVFLDIESAFDAVSHTAIKEALTKADIPPTIVNWISFMVSNRFITLSYCDTSLTRKVTKGSPQGGVLSPLLWNLTLNTFLNSLGIHSSFIQAFADDLVILIRGICKSTITEVAQQHLNNINRWCNTKGLKLSAIKSTAILFTNKRDNTLEAPLTISGYQIPVVNSTVYLGVTLDNKLGWGQHILRKCDTANSQLQACKRAVGKTWGLTPAGIKWIYNQVIIPSVMYSAITWHHTVEQKLYLKQRLTTLQRNAALSITRGLKSSPTDNLEILAGLQPIHLKLKETAIKAALRLKLNNTWISNHCLDRSKAKKSHAYNIDKTIANIPFSKCHITDLIPEVTVLDRRFSIQINDRLKAKDLPLNLSRNTWQIFTDGSKQGHNTGAGFTVIKHLTEHHATHFSLGTIATVYQSELFAINMGTIWAINNINPHSDIAIFSDSQAVIKALNNPQVKSRMILETINSLNTLGNNNKVSINWIPGHEGVPGNERADELARQGSSTRPVGPEPFVPLPTSFITREIHNSLTNSHLKEYNKAKLSEKGKTPLLHYLKTCGYRTISNSGTNIRWLTWLYTGHSPLNYFQHKTGNFTTPLCATCGIEEETSEHFPCNCFGYMTIRLRIFGKHILTMEELASYKTDKIIKYVKSTGRLNQADLFG